MKLRLSKKQMLLGGAALLVVFSFLFGLRALAPMEEKTQDGPKEEKPLVVEAPAKTEVIPPPISFDIPMPYTVQAPFANWTVHDESCEEAAILMYHHFLSGEGAGQINQTKADTDLRALRAWQLKNWGKEIDLNLTKVGELAKGYWGYSYSVTEDVTKEMITKELASGKPVLVPVMTHSLKNPNYGRENSYHVLVLKGYDALGVITNDAGISKGMNYKYSWEILFSAIDAQTKLMNQGRDMLTLSK